MNQQTQTGCSITRTLEVIGGKWTVLIIRDLLTGPKRFGQLEESLVGISPRTLSERLHELEREDIVMRRCEEGHHPIYELTERGKSLQSILDQMRKWGERSKKIPAA